MWLARHADELTAYVRMGVGGLFGFIGRFRNEVLGMYRAYATDSINTVVLDFGGSKVVVTPDDPAGFVAAIEEAGDVPLPPYIQRSTVKSDRERYQTIYATKHGAVAAPTAAPAAAPFPTPLAMTISSV